jgi:dienelactone hydrolase
MLTRSLLLPALVLSTAAACTEAPTTRVLFDRGADDLTQTILPSDRYKGEVVLDAFSEAQLALLPFLRQLRFTAQTGWAPTTPIRIPLTPARTEPEQWLDADTVPGAIRLYRVDTNPAVDVPLGSHVYHAATGALHIRPEALLAPGRYAIVVLDGRLRTRAGDPIEPSADAVLVRAAGDTLTDPDFAVVAATDPDIDRRSNTLAFVTFTVTAATAQTGYLQQIVTGAAPAALGDEDVTFTLSPFMPEEGRQLAIVGQPVATDDATIDAVFTAAGLEALPRAAIGRITGGLVVTPNFISAPQPDLAALFTNHTILGRGPLLPFSPTNPPALSATAPFRPLPFIAFFPKTPLPNAPVIVALHPVTSQKEAFFAFAHAACQAGHALIAIDLFQHGARQADITPAEGHFSDRLDVVLQGAGVAFPDPFFNLTFLARTRDRLRQTLVDTLSLIHILDQAEGADPRIDINADGTPDAFGPIRIVGHSLGASVGLAAAALSPAVDRVVVAAPGANLMQILDESPVIGRRLGLLLLATGNADGIGLMAGSERRLVPEHAEREVFSIVAETILAPVDTVTWLGALGARQASPAPLRVLALLPAGDSTFTPAAHVRFADALRTAAEDAEADHGHLGEDLLGLGWPTVTDTSKGFPTITTATYAADHGFLLDFADPAVTAAAQAQAAAFLAAP